MDQRFARALGRFPAPTHESQWGVPLPTLPLLAAQPLPLWPWLKGTALTTFKFVSRCQLSACFLEARIQKKSKSRKWAGAMAAAQTILVIVMIAVASIGDITTQKLTKRNREWRKNSTLAPRPWSKNCRTPPTRPSTPPHCGSSLTYLDTSLDYLRHLTPPKFTASVQSARGIRRARPTQPQWRLERLQQRKPNW
jgi:hypothetical protein